MPLSGRAAAGNCRAGASPICSIVNSGKAATALPLGVAVPFGESPAGGHDKAGLGCGCLQFLAVPAVQRLLHRRRVVRAFEQRQQAVAMMRQIGVQPHPAAVAAAKQPGDGVVIFLIRLAVDAQIALTAKLDCGISHVHTDVLVLTGAHPPHFRGSQCRSRNRGLGCSADRE